MTVKRPQRENFPSFCCRDKYACTSFCIVSTLLCQRSALEIFWQAALCFHFHKRCGEGVRERERGRGGGVLGKVKGCCRRFEGAFEKRRIKGGR